MRPSGVTIAIVCGAIAVTATGATGGAWAQLRPPPAMAPCSVLRDRPCHPAFCGVFHRGPCFPENLPVLGEDLWTTAVSTDEHAPANAPRGAAADNGNAAKAGPGETVNSIRTMFAALRACWVPPPKDQARHGMEYTVRFAFKRDGDIIGRPRRTYSSRDAPAQVRDIYRDTVDAAIQRCTPLHFSNGMANAIAGRPISIRFIDDRTIDAH
jgi:hypothetical protein